MDLDYLNDFRKLQQQIEKLDISSSPNEEIIHISLLNDLNLWIFPFTKIVKKFERLTINKSLPGNNNLTITEVKFLKYPPPDSVIKYNRANLKKQSILYATFLLPTILNENNPDKGDLVTISYWELREENTPLVVYPVFDYFNTKNLQLKNEFNKGIQKYPEDLKDIVIIDNCLIASYFSKYIEKGKEINYTFSAHIADRIFNKMYNGKIEAIIYPSVKDITGIDNIALKPDVFDKKYKLVRVKESLVVSKERDSIILHEMKRTKNFDDTFIKW
ncbi:MAG: hypothetical protein ABR936_15105 [Bacteroidota bacterium]|jgi:hypothetical protein